MHDLLYRYYIILGKKTSMGKRFVKQVVIFMKTESGKAALPQCRKRLQEEGFLVAIRQAPFLLEGGEKQPETMSEGIVFLTDCGETAARLTDLSCAALGYLNEENLNDSFGETRFLISGTEALSVDYLETVYRRQMGFPLEILSTARCMLRETVVEDVDAFYGIYAEPSITRYMEGLFEDRNQERRYIEAYRKCMYEFYGYGFWTVILRKTGEIIGRAGLTMRAGSDVPELGFVIGVPWQGRGLAREVCEAILKYGEEELGFEEVQAYVEPENIVSGFLLQALGFTVTDTYTERDKNYLKFHKILGMS